MFQGALSIAGKGRAIQHGHHDPSAGNGRSGLGGCVETDQEGRGIGIARRLRRVAKRLFQVLSGRARGETLRVRTAGAPEFDNTAGGLPAARSGGRRARGLPRRILGTRAEHKGEETLLRLNCGKRKC